MKILDIETLKQALNSYCEVNGLGSQSRLSEKSGVSTMVISRVSRGTAKTTQHSWEKMHKAEPAFIPPPSWKDIEEAHEPDPAYGSPFMRLKLYAEMLRLSKEAGDADLSDYIVNIVKTRLDEIIKEDDDAEKKERGD